MDTQEGRTRYYYIRDREKKPRVTICLLETKEGVVAKGVSICSILDNPSKRVGRDIAFGRATQAVMKGNSLKDRIQSPKVKTALDLIDPVEYTRLYLKKEWNPELTEFERRLLHGEREV